MNVRARDSSSKAEQDANSSSNVNSADDSAITPKQLPKSVVLGKDGKPCRSCTSFAAWAAMSKKNTPSSTAPSTGSIATDATTSPSPSSSSSLFSSSSFDTPLHQPPDCPPDVEALGAASWTLLHSMTATYPETASHETQATARQFIASFASLYPCWYCGSDFRQWMAQRGNAPRVSSRAEFGVWMCEAHNAVNAKLGKKSFDCARWEERWRTGWRDGRCG